MSEPARIALEDMTPDELKASFAKFDLAADAIFGTEPLTPDEMTELTQWIATQERILGGNTKK